MRNRVAIAVAVIVGVLAVALPAAARPAATTVKVVAGKPSEFHFQLSVKSVARGPVTFVVTNKGTVPHDFKIAGKTTPLINPGSSKTLKVIFKKAGKYPYLCTVSGHAAAGMKGTLVVK